MAQQAQHYQQPVQYQYPHYQQYQQYQQSQSPQYQQSQSPQSQQYPQPAPHQQHQAYNYHTHQPQPPSYAQVYAQQYSQQYPQQYQQPYPQHHSNAQQYGPSPSGSYPQQQAQASEVPTPPPEPETCYNCGIADHFAQNCPEPRREVPAGSLKRQKRHYSRRPQHNTNGQINTNMQPPQPYQQSTYPQQGYSQYQQPYSPATPQSAQSPTSQQWRRPGHQQQHQYQHNQHPPTPAPYQAQSSYYQSQAYSTPATPAPGSQSSPAQASPPASHQGSIAQTPQLAQASQIYWPSNGSEAAAHSQHSDTQTSQDHVHPDEELEEDDLNDLDIPDLPPSTQLYGEAILKRVSRPLPANFIVADAILPIPPPAPEAEVIQHIECSSYWDDHKEDTIFQQIVDDGDSIPIAVCLAKVKERQKSQAEEEIRGNSRSQSRSVAPRSAEAAEMAESLETLERALAEAKAKQAEMIRNRRKAKLRQPSDGIEHPQVKDEQQSPPQFAVSNIPSQRTGNTEDILASLGVTGDPKPVPAATRRVSQTSPPGSAVDDAGRYSFNDLSNTYPPNFQGNAVAQYSQKQGHSAHLPPPRPPLQTSPHEYRVDQSPDSGVVDQYAYSTNGNSHQPCGNDGQAASPTQYHTERSLSRKRSYDQCEESSSEEGDSPRRQEDDITPKHKKRQPKVAAAYSRRW